jgi:hypothetical protein
MTALVEELWRAWEQDGRQRRLTYSDQMPRKWKPKFGGHRKTVSGGTHQG